MASESGFAAVNSYGAGSSIDAMREGHRVVPTSTHWGNYKLHVRDGVLHSVEHYPQDRDPTPLAKNLLSAQDEDVRVRAPVVREGYLRDPEGSSGAHRGREAFVEVSWEQALDLAADALRRTIDKHGNQAIYGGSYGWASAGRFHHAQSQIHRFLNCIGGYTRSLYSYSAGAAEVIIPRILGMNFYDVMFQGPTLEDIARENSLVVCFGGIALKNTQVMSGGLGGHDAESRLRDLVHKKIRFVNVSPIRDDLPRFLNHEWLPIRPCSDAALMLAIAHFLLSRDLHDKAFVARYCVGLEDFAPYVLGETDGVPKDSAWAARLCDLDAERIERLAREIAEARPMIGVSWSLQRAEHGEQTYWLATVLAALLGTHGLPGKGVSYGYGSIHNIGFSGRRLPNFAIPAFPQGERPINHYIPVSRIADVLLQPGEPMDFNGKTLHPPKLELIYWAGGNPFHHHQDLNRLREAWARPQTVIVHEPFWTATARRADIVFPVTLPMERDDLGITPYDCHMTPMPRALAPFGQARDDFAVFAELAKRLGAEHAFTEGLNIDQWLRRLYGELKQSAARKGVALPEFEEFWQGEQFSIAQSVPERVFGLERFRQAPDQHPLATPSGKIEISSATIASFGYADCLGHPAWFDKVEFLGAPRSESYPLHLVSNQPRGRLHSQFDHGAASRACKRAGRERLRMNTSDAKARGLLQGELVRVFNDRGACLAVVDLSGDVRGNVVELPTGAWYEPDGDTGLDLHGNPNVLTRDAPTSRLAQATSAHSCLVEVEKFTSEARQVTAHKPPNIVANYCEVRAKDAR